MSELKFYLKGAFEGDGHFIKKRFGISINVIDFDFLEEIKTTIKQIYDIDVNIVKQVEAKGNCKEQRRINFICGKDIYLELKDSIPQTQEEKIQYLKGLFDAEGSVGICKKMIRKKNGKVYNGNEKWLTLSQKDIKKLDLWNSYMNEFGINTIKTYTKNGRSFLSIRNNESIRNFNKLIGFRIKRKQEKLNQLINNLRQSQLSKVEKAKIISIYTQTNFGSEYLAKMFGRTKPAILSILKNKKIRTSKYRQRKISYDDIDIAEAILGRELPFKLYMSKIETFSSKGIRTSKIKSIKFHSRTKGIDLVTEKYHNFFLGNNILSHNSTLAGQVGFYIAWMLAGGEMDFENDCVKKAPKKKINFNLQENYCFSAEELQDKALVLFNKHGKNQVIVYDEGRQGLDSARTMESVNKGMEDFFQECGFMGHVIIVVLPNFFKLHEDYAVARSLFLIDVFAKGGLDRGYFNFYNELTKENLYYFGKKRIGVTAKYFATRPNFWGRFTRWLPFDKDEYETLKKEAIDKKRKTRRERNLLLQRDFFIWMLSNVGKFKDAEVLEELQRVVDISMSGRTLELARARVNEVIIKKKGY